jgi:ABC-type antimicrobial peptide transport system permease subunit
LLRILIEGVLLAAISGTAAVLLLTWTGALLPAVLPASFSSQVDLRPDIRGLSFTLLTALITGAAFTLISALMVTGFSPMNALKYPEGGLCIFERRFTLMKVLMVLQAGDLSIHSQSLGS